jgi:hypothetical protein
MARPLLLLLLTARMAQSVWLGLDGWGSIPDKVRFFSMESRLALGPTQPPIFQWDPEGSLPGEERHGREADRFSPFNVEVQNGEAITRLLMSS